MKFDLSGINSNILFEKTLQAIDNGVSVSELKKNPLKYLVSGFTKEIVVWKNGGGGKLSRLYIEEMAKLGDPISLDMISLNPSKKYRWYFIEKCFPYTKNDNDFDKDKNETFINYSSYNEEYRENEYLISILKNNVIKYNSGGWNMEIYKVYIEEWSYNIIVENDGFGSEIIYGNIEE